MNIRFTSKALIFTWLVVLALAGCTSEPESAQSNSASTDTSAVVPQPLGGTNAEEDASFIGSEAVVSPLGPTSITRGVIQDSNGDMWFASWQGIIRYDGTAFTNVTLEQGLKRYRVFSLLEDSRGNLWFGTMGAGVYRYDGRSFRLFTTADGLASNSVVCLMQDRSGAVWMGTTAGVSRFDGYAISSHITHPGVTDNFTSAIAQDKNGMLWFGTNAGVSCYDGKSFVPFTIAQGTPFMNVRSILADRNGMVWIASQTGLCRYDGRTQTTVSTQFVGNIFEDKTGNLWLSEGDSKGMTLVRYDGKTFTPVKRDTQVFGVTQDNSGMLWFGTANGVCRYDGKTFTKFDAPSATT
jgi:ligand-binding sensor domain-containing protein